MRERRPLPGPETEVSHANLFGVESIPCNTRLPSIPEAVRGSRILNVGKVDDRVRARLSILETDGKPR
jgi:hypothetical protein